MQRQWLDPRDGTEWLVTASPFVAPNGSPAISFHRPGRTPVWTRHPLFEPLEDVTDDELMDLLDRARDEARRTMARPRAVPRVARLGRARPH